MSQLPTELIDAVVDVIYDDKPALRACALIAKAWTPRTRFWLFRAIQVGSPLGAAGRGGMQGGVPLKPHFLVIFRPQFMQFVRRARHLLGYLTDLRLVLERDELQHYRDDWDYICSKIPAGSPICRLHIETLEPGDIASLMRLLRPHIASLDLFSFWTCNWNKHMLWRMLDLYPELRTVFAAPSYIPDPADDEVVAPGEASVRRTYVVHWEDAMRAREWGCHSSDRDAIYLPRVVVGSGHDVTAMCLEATLIAPLVRGLELTLGTVDVAAYGPLVRGFRELRVLHLAYLARSDPCMGLASLLRAIEGTCTRLRAVVFDLARFERPHQGFLAMDWAALDARLADPAWIRVHLYVPLLASYTAPFSLESLREYIVAQLSRAAARRQLHLTWHEKSKIFIDLDQPRETYVHLAVDG
ncbi:hypothetical protein AURDEDRAFT_183276 [Auricularia subglabra TFB-10046 SS5]|nr:hypothetical protein AURDEDRAFT_183276 [Auricularia subglabra TFB-10046 SS5]